MLARNVDRSELTETCLKYLSKLCCDPSDKVRRTVVSAFEHMPAPTKIVGRFARKVWSGGCLKDGADYAIDYAKRVLTGDFKLAVTIAEHTQMAFGKDIVDPQKFAFTVNEDLVSIAIAVHTRAVEADLKCRGMDLFERVMDLGSEYASKALKSVGR